MADTAGKRAQVGTTGKVQGGKLGGDFVKTDKPDYIPHRLEMFNELYKKQQEDYKAAEHPEITVTLPDGKEIKAKAFETTPLDIATGISKGLAEAVVGARIEYTKRLPNPISTNLVAADSEDDKKHGDDKDIYDLNHKLEGDCKLALLKFDSKEGKTLFWHSSAHLLGEAIENLYGAHLTHGPALENGFFYDAFIGNNAISPDQFGDIEKQIESIIAANQPFQRLVITKEQAAEMFKHNPFKLAFINAKIPDGAATSVYRSGNFIDLCTGPHVPSTGKIKACKLTNSSSSYWLANNMNDSLQRVYGISFPTKKELTEHVKREEELEKRGHKNIGEQQKLFMFSKYAPGCPNFLKHGTRIYNRMANLIRKEYVVRGFQEVKTSLMNNEQLWMTSGHFFKYKDDMFVLKVENQDHALKPMNCPCHCAIFDSGLHSYRDLPIRMADFGALHRNELSGALAGLTRVRQFHQDDAHVFCTEDQLLEEMKNCLDFIEYVYSLFGFQYSLELSTRPELRVGSDEIWDKAEACLRDALVAAGKEFKVNPGDGAFYGPKIDIKVKDCFSRVHQLGTIQLDFNMPERFNLQYRAPDDAAEDKAHQLTEKELEEKIAFIKKDDQKIEIMKQHKLRVAAGEQVTVEQVESEHKVPVYTVSGKLKPGFKRPIMIHRAIFGSLERCIAILCEHWGGKWPFWISPRQMIVIPISEKFEAYAEKVANRLLIEGYYVDVDKSNAGINKKVRNAQIEQYNFLLVVGEKEEADGSVTVRERDQEKPKGVFKVEDYLKQLQELAPHESEAYKKIKDNIIGKSSSSKKDGENSELSTLDKKLSGQVYLSGEGLDHGEEDQTQFEKLKDSKVDAAVFPNLARWIKFVAAKHHKK